jgi:CRISPR-associated protein Csd1
MNTATTEPGSSPADVAHASPLAALVEHYQQLVDDPDQDVAPLGFSRQKISFRVVIEPDGRLHAIQDAREAHDSTKPTARTLVVPGQDMPTGDITKKSAAKKVRLLRGDVRFVLGLVRPNPQAPDDPAKASLAFQAFRRHHLEIEDEVSDPGFSSVCRFLETWDPEAAPELPDAAIYDQGGAFVIRGAEQWVHERPAIQAFWRSRLQQAAVERDNAAQVRSLLTNKPAAVARVHQPKIKGVTGGQGAQLLVSFDKPSYTSFGKTQSYNAPVAADEAFQYCTALNRLLANPDRRVRLGDTTAVFWTARPTGFNDVAAFFLGGVQPPTEAEQATLNTRVQSFIEHARRGAPHPGVDDPDTPFYILGLSPNAARISVRFWMPQTTGQLADRLAQHHRDLDIVGLSPDRPLTVRRILAQTAREAKDIPHQLAGALTRSILTARPYPQALFAAILRRLRADTDVNDRRAAVLKACLIRNHDHQEPLVSLNKDHPDAAYHMGRLFATLEKTQQDALPGLNKTIKDGYFSTASATPGAVFPRLLRLHQHHIEKLDGGLKVNREKLMQEVCSHIDQFPMHLPLPQQGLFAVAYYHQRQDFFTPRKQDESGADRSD